MKTLADVVKMVVGSVCLDKTKLTELAKGSESFVESYARMNGFVYADLYSFFDPENGKLCSLQNKLLEIICCKPVSEDDILAVLDRAFIDGYKAGFDCREKMNDEILFDEKDLM